MGYFRVPFDHVLLQFTFWFCSYTLFKYKWNVSRVKIILSLQRLEIPRSWLECFPSLWSNYLTSNDHI